MKRIELNEICISIFERLLPEHIVESFVNINSKKEYKLSHQKIT
jgi:hypothetical protein